MTDDVPNERYNFIKPTVWYTVNSLPYLLDAFEGLLAFAGPFVCRMSRETHLSTLFQLFRQYGYDGVSLSKIAQATGLGKASLYHHFPGGKAEMLKATLTYSEQWTQENVVGILTGPGSACERFQMMCDRFGELYADGAQPCLIAALVAGAPRDIFQQQVQSRLRTLVDAIASVLSQAGLPAELAQQRGEDAVITIQGALLLSRGLDDSAPFQRAIAQLPQKLCEGLES